MTETLRQAPDMFYGLSTVKSDAKVVDLSGHTNLEVLLCKNAEVVNLRGKCASHLTIRGPINAPMEMNIRENQNCVKELTIGIHIFGRGRPGGPTVLDFAVRMGCGIITVV